MVKRHQVHAGSPPGQQDRHLVEDADGPAKGNAGAQRHQGVHIGSPVEEGAESGCEEIPVDDHDDCREDHLCQGQADVVVDQKRRKRPAPHIMAHGDVHEGREKEDGELQSSEKLRGRAVFQGILLPGELLAGPAFCRIRGAFLKSGAVACFLDRGDDIGACGSPLDSHRIRQKGYRDTAYSGNPGYRFLHMSLAGRAAHACDNVVFHRRSFPPAFLYGPLRILRPGFPPS